MSRAFFAATLDAVIDKNATPRPDHLSVELRFQLRSQRFVAPQRTNMHKRRREVWVNNRAGSRISNSMNPLSQFDAGIPEFRDNPFRQTRD